MPPGEIVALMPKPVTIFDPVVRLRVDMSREDVSEYYIPPHFTNIQHALQMARQLLVVAGHAQSADHSDHRRTADGPLRAAASVSAVPADQPHRRRPRCAKAAFCQREGITINIFLLPSWSQSSEDVQFAYRLAESTKGRVFFTAGRDLDRYVVWDYLNRRREIIA